MSDNTRKRIKNWIYYNKWYVAACVLLLIFTIRYIAGIFGIAEPHPDLQAAYVGRHVLTKETVTQLQDLLAQKAGDYNNDGKVLVEVRQYLTSDESGAAEAQQNAMASEVSLSGDIDSCDSYLFLLEDPEQFQIEWQLLADENGDPPASSDYTVDKKVIPLSQLLPDLSTIADETDRETISSLYMGRRCFYTEKTCENAEALAAMWDSVVKNSALITAAGGASSDASAPAGGDSQAAQAASQAAGGGSQTEEAASHTAGGASSAESAAQSGAGQAGDADSAAIPLPTPDEKGMFTVGNNISAPHSLGDMTLNEYNEALSANGFYYATWTSGEPSSITNSEGEAALLYPRQLYMVTYEGTNASDAESKAVGWLAAAKKNYKVTSESSFSAGGREYTILEYTFPDASNPYAQGVSAFISSQSRTAVCAELVSTDPGDASLRPLLESFLSSLK